MKALVKFGKGRAGIELRDIPKPTPKEDELLIKISAAGICGTDLHIMNDDYKYYPPVVLGHEYTGFVESIGEQVEGFEIGDRVISLTAAYTCGKCSYCVQGLLMLCDQRRSIGSGLNGAMAEYMVIPARLAFAIPKESSLGDSLVIAEPLACCIRAVTERSPVKAGDIVVVSGPGVIGQLTAQLVKMQGGLVILSGLPSDRDRLDLALNMGVADEIVTDAEQLKKVVSKYSPNGADVVFECAGAAPSLQTCIEIVKKSGHLAQIGLFGKSVPVDVDAILNKELTLSTSCATEPTSWEVLMKLIQQEKLNLEPLTGPFFSLEDWEEAFDAAVNQEGYKVVINP